MNKNIVDVVEGLMVDAIPYREITTTYCKNVPTQNDSWESVHIHATESLFRIDEVNLVL